MSSETANSPIARSAARLRWAVFAAMALMLMFYLAARFGGQLGVLKVEAQEHGPPASARVIGDIRLAFLMIALFQLTQMLARIASGELFTSSVIGKFRSFALWLLLMALFSLTAPILAEFASLSAGGAHHLAIRIDFREVLTVGVTLVLFLLARLLERARALDEEMREFV
jgi:DUF2975 family protein